MRGEAGLILSVTEQFKTCLPMLWRKKMQEMKRILYFKALSSQFIGTFYCNNNCIHWYGDILPTLVSGVFFPPHQAELPGSISWKKAPHSSTPVNESFMKIAVLWNRAHAAVRRRGASSLSCESLACSLPQPEVIMTETHQDADLWSAACTQFEPRWFRCHEVSI